MSPTLGATAGTGPSRVGRDSRDNARDGASPSPPAAGSPGAEEDDEPRADCHAVTRGAAAVPADARTRGERGGSSDAPAGAREPEAGARLAAVLATSLKAPSRVPPSSAEAPMTAPPSQARAREVVFAGDPVVVGDATAPPAPSAAPGAHSADASRSAAAGPTPPLEGDGRSVEGGGRAAAAGPTFARAAPGVSPDASPAVNPASAAASPAASTTPLAPVAFAAPSAPAAPPAPAAPAAPSAPAAPAVALRWMTAAAAESESDETPPTSSERRRPKQQARRPSGLEARLQARPPSPPEAPHANGASGGDGDDGDAGGSRTEQKARAAIREARAARRRHIAERFPVADSNSSPAGRAALVRARADRNERVPRSRTSPGASSDSSPGGTLVGEAELV